MLRPESVFPPPPTFPPPMSSSPPRDQQYPALIAQILGQLAFGLRAMTLCIPSMAEWGVTYGTSQAMVQLTFSGYVAAYGLLQLLYGPLSDRLGRRRVLLAGLAIALVGTLLAAPANNIVVLIVARTLQGAGAAAGMVVGRALVQDLFVGSARTRMMAGLGMAMGLCPPAGTLIGGQLHEAFGWRAPFWLTLAMGLMLAIVAWHGLPHGASAASADQAAVADRDGSRLRAPLARTRLRPVRAAGGQRHRHLLCVSCRRAAGIHAAGRRAGSYRPVCDVRARRLYRRQLRDHAARATAGRPPDDRARAAYQFSRSRRHKPSPVGVA